VADPRPAQPVLITEPCVTFEVLGSPIPQGSKTAFVGKGGRVVVKDGRDAAARARHRSWRGAVAEAARDAAAGLPGPMDGPLALSIQFRMQMPASRPKRLRTLGVGWHTTRPDLTKLTRSTEDALKEGGLIADDARICQLVVTKLECVGWTGASIWLGPAGVPSARDRSLPG
jgi:Holliday junction resolvase RusA-like endonuclease